MEIDAKRILISTQGPNKEPYKSEIEFLFKSLKMYGGKLSQSKKIACFSEIPDPLITKKLENLGVKIKIIDEVDTRSPHSNKIQMLSLYDSEDFDILVALDSDIVVIDDFTNYLDLESFCAKPVDQDPLSIDDWKILFDYFQINLPSERYFTSFHMTKTIPYFNSGVLIIPKKFLSNLYESWKFYAKKLLDSYDDLPNIKKFSFFTDQFSLSLSLASLQIPIKPLPVEMNFPTHVAIHESLLPEELTPILLHYHHFSSIGTITHCPYENINKIIDNVNEKIIQKNSIDNKNQNIKTLKKIFFKNKNNEFDNKIFWENRYHTNLELGSEIGTRGEHLEYKKRIIEEIITKYTPASILDIGCGDLEVMKSMNIKHYVGIDLSKTIIKRNQSLKPEWNFFQGTFLNLCKTHKLQADFVICLDVLIHQQNYKEYFPFVRKIVNSCDKIGLIAGFDEKPSKEFSSEITFFHEPITQTLKKLHINNYKIVGNYRGLSLVLFEKTKFSSPKNIPPNDIQQENLDFALNSTSDSSILLELVNLSRKNFGWFVKHLPRSFEYPWLINQIDDFDDKLFLDIGAGVTPLPIYLAEKNSHIFTLDPHPVVRNMNENPSDWNEWGFLDYSVINKNIQSLNINAENANFPENYFDYIYSISVIEHVPAETRREIWKKISQWIKPQGALLLTIDLYPNEETLWNFAEGKEVENISTHGNLSTLKDEIQVHGFKLHKYEFLRKIPQSRVDCVFLSFRKL